MMFLAIYLSSAVFAISPVAKRSSNKTRSTGNCAVCLKSRNVYFFFFHGFFFSAGGVGVYPAQISDHGTGTTIVQ
jgi:hypothetical protein